MTAANLRAGLGQRLRARYERGMTLAELSAACHRPQEEIRELLSRAGADLSPPAGAGGGGRTDGGLRAPNADRVALPRTAQASSVPVARPTVVPPPVRAEGATARTKRPSPARRLSRLHPRGPAVDATAPPAVQPADGPTGAHGSAEPAGPETPLGILIGGTPNRPEPESRPAAERYVLVDARMVRPGRGSCLVVLPSWRPAIAVSVPTEQLMEATGLGFDQLPGAELSVLIDPEALHDRELGLHGWRTGSVARGGARLRRG
ncbi:hypothetical protein [Kitasatospora sp. NBC_00315]|uniref:hypothetical protein n=1 Tax=Kitasatospora sp. NBC_00315 TaxID=2975963 RepID=UPI00324894E8